ncbi:hypothetical protein EV700_0683 [Fluviicoccus keumensis]|uniref:UPF0235 protein EV700_0683 n=1 Tax=Fluviicoccus keumensis TaxID=1435465 RepID=A0A4V2G680_9GAMM|nr:hypothetical protein EV700_0683 [Fluviicoccus keumensis]
MRRDGEDYILSLHVQPGARRSGLDGLHGDAIKVRLQAPPVDGKANDELCRFIAGLFQVKRQDVSLISGETSRQKRIRIARAAGLPDAIKTMVQGTET